VSPPGTRATSAATRGRLLAAAAAVVRRDGARALTLDAVAAEAGVSKGGLLYHFPHRRDLVRGLVADWMERFEIEVEETAAGEKGGGAWTRAYLSGSDMTRVAPAERDAEFSLLSVLIDAPEELDFVRERYAAWQAQMNDDGIDSVDATLVRLAADGLWFADLLGLAPPTGRTRAEVLNRLQALTTDD
jgi:AcrR family transcriptional regulator